MVEEEEEEKIELIGQRKLGGKTCERAFSCYSKSILLFCAAEKMFVFYLAHFQSFSSTFWSLS